MSDRTYPYWATRIERVGMRRVGCLLDGRTWDQYPEGWDS